MQSTGCWQPDQEACAYHCNDRFRAATYLDLHVATRASRQREASEVLKLSAGPCTYTHEEAATARDHPWNPSGL